MSPDDICTESEVYDWVFNEYIKNELTPPKTLKTKVKLCIMSIINNQFYKIISNKPLTFEKARHIFYGDEKTSTVLVNSNIEKLIEKRNLIKHERDLHNHLELFLNRLNISSSTIYHEISKKDFNLYWLHPDMVGRSLNNLTILPEVNELSKNIGISIVDIYSFEIKKEVTFSNLRKCYFQAVSNSSWANYGYLVVQDIDIYDQDLINEFHRLNQEFRIGLIKLDVVDNLRSRIIIPSIKRKEIDRNLINIMCEKNEDFMTFIKEINNSFYSFTNLSLNL